MNDLLPVLAAWYALFGPPQGRTEAALAAYKQSGMERMMTDYANSYPKGFRLVIERSVIIGSGVANHYVTYGWSF